MTKMKKKKTKELGQFSERIFLAWTTQRKGTLASFVLCLTSSSPNSTWEKLTL